MNKELRPCPFCGETPEIVYLDTNKNKKWFFVMCRGLACGVKVETSKRGSTREEAINLWNHRPIEDGLREQADELETYISKLVYELTDGNLSKPYDVQVVADEVSRIWQEYTDTKVAEAIAEAEAENERLRAALRDAAETMEWVLAGQPGGTFFIKYKGRVQDSLRSARQIVEKEQPHD